MTTDGTVKESSRWRALASASIAILALVACGGSSTTSGGTKTIPDYGPLFKTQVSPPPGDAAAQLAYYKNIAQQAQKPATFDSFGGKPALPIVKNKRMMIVICTAGGAGCVLQGQGGAQAATAAGWRSTTVDGQGSAQVQANTIEQAIVQHYDGIYLVVIDRNTVATALAHAHQAGIPVVSSISGNTPGGDLFASVDALDFHVGQELAAYAIARANGKPLKAAAIYLTNAGVNLFRAQGFVAQINACNWCSLVEAPLDYTFATLNDIPARVSALIQKHPDINYIFMDVGPFVGYVVQGMTSVKSIAQNMMILSTDCVPDQLARMAARAPFPEICDGYASIQAGWGAVDELSRAMQNQQPGSDHVATQLFTSDNINLIKQPQTIGYDVDNIDYRKLYLQSWGLS